MKNLILTINLFLVFSITAIANPISFSASTSGVFVTSNSPTISVGNTNVTFSSKPNEINVVLEPNQTSNITLGVFNAASDHNSWIGFGNQPFKLTINVAGFPQFNGELLGTINSGASGAYVTWQNRILTFNNGLHQYTIFIEERTPINAPSSPDASRIRAQILYQGAAVPEPGTLFLVGLGFAAAATSLKKKPK